MIYSDIVTKDSSVIVWGVCIKTYDEEWFHSAYITRSRAKDMAPIIEEANSGKAIVRKMIVKRVD